VTAVCAAPAAVVAPPDAAGSRPRRLHGLTALRFFAAVAVVLVHVRFQFSGSRPLTTAAAYGYLGVSFFFLLSGFVLTWAESGQRASRFWWGRITRIWPLHVACLVVAFTVVAAQEQLPGTGGRIAEILLLQAWSPDPSVYYGGNGVSWSLSCEMFFYLLFPLVVRPVRRLGARGLAVLAGGTGAALLLVPLLVGSSVSAGTASWLFYVFPPYRFGEFLLGMVLARAVSLGLRVRRPRAAAAVALGGLAVLVLVLTRVTLAGAAPARPLVALAALPLFALLVLATTGAEARGGRTGLGRPSLVRLGEWSFALFLVHKPVLLLAEQHGWWQGDGGLGGLLGFASFLAVATAVAAAVHLGLERPVDRLLRRLPVGTGRGLRVAT
jgi:peptidoglycan/LPS O-acetylase OafA/YrhL